MSYEGRQPVVKATQYQNTAGTNFFTTQAPGGLASNLGWTYPSVGPLAGQVLTSVDTSGTLGYINPFFGEVANVAPNDSNVVFTSADNPYQVCTPTAPRTYTLPSSGIVKGATWTFINTNSSWNLTTPNTITLNASDASNVSRVYPGLLFSLIALIDNPVTHSDWRIKNIQSALQSDYVPIFNGATVLFPSVSCFLNFQSDWLYVNCSFIANSPTSSFLSMSLPTGIEVVTSQLNIGNMVILGNTPGVSAMSCGNGSSPTVGPGAYYSNPSAGLLFGQPANTLISGTDVQCVFSCNVQVRMLNF